MLKWVDKSTNYAEWWHLGWFSNAGFSHHLLVVIYRSRNEGAVWRLTMLEDYKRNVELLAATATAAKHRALCEVVQFAADLSKQASEMVLELAKSGDQ